MGGASRISVVLPALNEEESIRECLSSLHEQTHPADEIIVVDGGSGDSTLQRVGEFPSVTSMSHPRPNTPGALRNEGTRRATGDIVLFIDSDCVADSRLLEFHTRAYQNVDSLDGAKGYTRSASEGPVAEMIQSQILSQEWIDNLNPDGTIRFQSSGAANLSMRRRVMLRHPFREDLVSCEDTDLYLRMRNADLKVFFEPRAIVSHRHSNTLLELFRQLSWYGEGFFELAGLWSPESFRRFSIYGTSFRFTDWSSEELRDAVVSNHRLICRGCPHAVCEIESRHVDGAGKFTQEMHRQISCLGFAAGVLRKRTGYKYDWSVGHRADPQG